MTATPVIRVAVCDDARAVKLYLRHVLEEEGDMEVVSATSGGQQALDALARTPADILMLDLLLPDVPEPAALVRRLRELAPRMGIVLMSNMPPSRLEHEARELGTDGWLPKTYKAAQMRAEIRAVVAERT